MAEKVRFVFSDSFNKSKRFCSSSSASGTQVKKSFYVIFLPDSSISLNTFLTTLALWLSSLLPVAFLQVYTRIFHAKIELISHIALIFTAYFFGFEGMYCRNWYLPLQQTNCLSTVIWDP